MAGVAHPLITVAKRRVVVESMGSTPIYQEGIGMQIIKSNAGKPVKTLLFALAMRSLHDLAGMKEGAMFIRRKIRLQSPAGMPSSTTILQLGKLLVQAVFFASGKTELSTTHCSHALIRIQARKTIEAEVKTQGLQLPRLAKR